MTISTGTGSFITFEFLINSPVPVLGLEVTATIKDMARVRIRPPFKIFQTLLPIKNRTIFGEKQLENLHDVVRVLLVFEFKVRGKELRKTEEFLIGDKLARPDKNKPLWLSFEDDDDLQFTKPFFTGALTAVPRNSTEGKRALLVRLKSNQKYGGGVSLFPLKSDWSQYRQLKFDLFFTGTTKQRFSGRFSPIDGIRYFYGFNLNPGWNENIAIPLTEPLFSYKAPDGERRRGKLKILSQIKEVLIYTGPMPESADLYIDNIRLVK